MQGGLSFRPIRFFSGFRNRPQPVTEDDCPKQSFERSDMLPAYIYTRYPYRSLLLLCHGLDGTS